MLFVPAIATPRRPEWAEPGLPTGRRPWAYQRRPSERRGVVLLVVIAMLALFAAVGLSFVFYAEGEANAARITAQADTLGVADADAELLLAAFLSQFIIGVDNEMITEDKNGNGILDAGEDTNGNNVLDSYPNNHNVASSLRGHELARTMYGYNDRGLNTNPFNGVPRLATNDPDLGEPINHLLNYRYFADMDGAGMRILRDPGRMTNRKAPPPLEPTMAQFNRPANDPYIGENVSWTYADLENIFLGQVNANGEIIAQSYWRPWAVGTTGVPALTMDAAAGAAYQQIWGPQPGPNSSKFKYMTLRPLPCYNYHDPATNQPVFPAPEDGGGDVKNLDGFKGVKKPGGGGYYNNDSIWIDLGYPVRVAPNGKKYKPLFAPLIIDLDGRINLNIHGNVRGSNMNTPVHASNQGIGPWEVNIGKVLDQADWMRAPLYRYGPDGKPGKATGGTPPGWYWGGGGSSGPPFWGWGDLDGVKNDFSFAEKFVLPGQAGNFNHPMNNGINTPFPYFPLTTYGRGSTEERSQHPALFNYYHATHTWPALHGGDNTPADDRAFSLHQLEALYRYGGTGSHMLTGDLFKFMPASFGGPNGAMRRNLVTLHSSDLARPGITPFLPAYVPANNAGYQLQANPFFPTAQPPMPAPQPGPSPGGEFGQDYRGRAERASATRLMLQHPIWDPNLNVDPTITPPAGGTPMGGYRGLTAFPPTLPDGRIDLNDPPTAQALIKAINDREQFARMLFNRLRFVTTGARSEDKNDNGLLDPGEDANGNGTLDDPLPNQAQAAEYNACRWLAQLAANIVDYLDPDEYMTAFPWDKPSPDPMTWKYVFGTELPRVVLHEVYAEIGNAPGDVAAPATMNYKVNFWIELLNPQLIDQLPPGNPNVARLKVENGWACYNVTVLGRTDPSLRLPNNPTGKPNADPMMPDPNLVKLEVTDWDPEPPDMPMPPKHYLIEAIHQDYPMMVKDGWNKGFYLMGPKHEWPRAMMPTEPAPITTLKVKEQPPVMGPPMPGMPASALTYEVPLADPLNQPLPRHTILLRRLANPALPPNPPNDTVPPNPNLPHNPYITVDIVEEVPVNDGVQFSSTGARMMGNMPGQWLDFPARASYGKQQPFAAQALWDMNTNAFSPLSQIRKQAVSPPNMPKMQQPQHNMFEFNWPDAMPTRPTFDWLVHLDRHAISPIELLHVSTSRPHELTQLFILTNPANGQTIKHAHRGPYNPMLFGTAAAGVTMPWSQTDARLYRLLEYLDSGYRSAGFRDPPWPNNVTNGPYPGKMTLDGLTPGKLNINTIWDMEIFKALCDAQPLASNFTDNGSPNNDVQVFFTRLLQSRSPNYTTSTTVGGNDKPFRGFAAQHVLPPPAPPGTVEGVEHTLLRPADPAQPAGPRLFEIVPDPAQNPPPQDHPVIRTELLSKIFNNITTRSNVFAVWLTVGFFEVHSEDKNGNGVLDAGEDGNTNGVLDPGEDANGNGILDTEDTNRNKKLDHDLLGAEMGKSEGRHIRHRMFAIVDRTTMVMPEWLGLLLTPADPAQPQPQTIPVKKVSLLAATGTVAPSVEVRLQPGMQVEIDAELVQIQNVTYSNGVPFITATFTQPHAPDARIRVPSVQAVTGPLLPGRIENPLTGTPAFGQVPTVHGNPGPQLRFDHRNSKDLVPYYSIIK